MKKLQFILIASLCASAATATQDKGFAVTINIETTPTTQDQATEIFFNLQTLEEQVDNMIKSISKLTVPIKFKDRSFMHKIITIAGSILTIYPGLFVAGNLGGFAVNESIIKIDETRNFGIYEEYRRGGYSLPTSLKVTAALGATAGIGILLATMNKAGALVENCFRTPLDKELLMITLSYQNDSETVAQKLEDLFVSVRFPRLTAFNSLEKQRITLEQASMFLEITTKKSLAAVKKQLLPQLEKTITAVKNAMLALKKSDRFIAEKNEADSLSGYRFTVSYL